MGIRGSDQTDWGGGSRKKKQDAKKKASEKQEKEQTRIVTKELSVRVSSALNPQSDFLTSTRRGESLE